MMRRAPRAEPAPGLSDDDQAWARSAAYRDPRQAHPLATRLRRRPQSVPARLSEGHRLFRVLRPLWRVYQGALVHGRDLRQHNHQPSDRMPWWPR